MLFPVVSEKLPKSLKNLPPSFQNHPQNLPKSIRKPTKIRSELSLDKDQRDAVARSTIPAVLLGPPLPTLDDLKDDAAWWASNADDKELQVYLMAIFNALPADKQQAFTKHIITRTAA